MTEKLNKVFFLGAGFSKAIDSRYPVLNELTEYIAGKVRCDKSSLACHYDNELSGLIKDNVENLLTYLSTDWPWKSAKQKYTNKALYAEITEILSEYFVKLSKNDFTDKKFMDMNILCALCNSFYTDYKNIDFITLNYDWIVERCLSEVFAKLGSYNPRLDEYYKYPITEIGARGANPYLHYASPYEKIPSVIKLHGSANWFWEGVSASDQVYYIDGNESKEKLSLLSGLNPYIVPPVLDKSYFYNHNAIRYFWKYAYDLLKKADEIYIIGFSFPQTDLSVKHLFQSALRGSDAHVYVVNCDTKDNLLHNYMGIFGDRCTIHYDYCGMKDAFQKFVNEKLTNRGQPWS